MPQFKIHHVTRYSYDVPVRDSANQIILFPVKDEYQTVLKQDLIITGDPAVDVYKDYYGNEVGTFMFTEPHRELVIDSLTAAQIEQLRKISASILARLDHTDRSNPASDFQRSLLVERADRSHINARQ